MSQVDTQVSKQNKHQEETNQLLSALNDSMKKLIDIQGKKAVEAKSAAAPPKYPPPPSNVAPSLGTGSAAAPPATLGTGTTLPPTPVTPAQPVAPVVQPKLMPTFPPPPGFMASPSPSPGGGFPAPTGACGSGCATGPIGPQYSQAYKRMKTADGQWVFCRD